MPMWMVGLASGTLFLLVVAVVFFIYTRPTKSPTTPGASSTARPTGSAPPRTAATPGATGGATGAATAAAPIPGGGPFGNARSGFIAAITPPSGAVNAPTPPPAAPDGTPPDHAGATPDTTAQAAPTAAAATPDPPATVAVAAAAPSPQPVTPTPVSAPAPAAAPTVVAVASRPATTQRPVAAAAPPAPAPAAAAKAGGGTGLLSIVCFPACDQVVDNGKPLGPSPIWQHSVPAGEHRLKLTTSNPPATKVLSVIVASDELKTVKQTMTQ